MMPAPLPEAAVDPTQVVTSSLTEATLATCVVTKCTEEVDAPECGPVRIDEDALRISRLPQQEAGEPRLAIRSDNEIRVWQVRGVEMRRDAGGIDALRHALCTHTCCGEIGHERAGGVDDLLAPPVTEGEVDAKARAKGVLLRRLGGCNERRRQ